MKYMDGDQGPTPLKPSGEQVRNRIAEFLVNGSLYKRFHYDGGDVHAADTHAEGNPRFSSLPAVLKMYCDGAHCGQDTIWQTEKSSIYFKSGGFHHARYTCRNCRLNHQDYWFIWTEDKNRSSLFMKVG